MTARYIKGNVTTDAGVRYISNFCGATLTRADKDESDDEEKDPTDDEWEVPPLELKGPMLENILQRAMHRAEGTDAAEPTPDSHPQAQGRQRLHGMDAKNDRAVRRGRMLWTSPQDAESARARTRRPTVAGDLDAHISARRKKKQEPPLKPFAGKTQPRANYYQYATTLSMQQWLREVSCRDGERPNEEQLDFLRAIISRIRREREEELLGTQEETEHEPMLDLLHGLPGTGKSRVLGWVRELFESVLKWEHGVHFVCLAFQNSMAALIRGETIHHWSTIPVADYAISARDPHKLAIKCQSLRFIIIDEISMVSAELLGCLENVVRKAVRQRGTYKLRRKRAGMAEAERERVFGGVNMVFLGDWWQLRPPGQTALFCGATKQIGWTAELGQLIFWGHGPNAIRRLWELTTHVRCNDPWYNVAFLGCCREGRLTVDNWRFAHGYNTWLPGSTDGITPHCPCGSPQCRARAEACAKVRDAYETTEAQCPRSQFGAIPALRDYATKTPTSEDWSGMDCAACTAERRRRVRVLPFGQTWEQRFSDAPFDRAAAIYARNVPKYFTIQLRAREYAKLNQKELAWVQAKDVPKFQEDRALAPDELRKKLAGWLERQDQETSNIMGLLPLVEGLPVRLTQTIDRARQLYLGRRGRVVGWVSHPAETRTEHNGEWILSRQPLAIYVKFDGATWKLSDDLEAGVYPVTARSGTWKVNKRTGITARRTGFFLIPDFAATAHMVQGQTLEAVFAEATELMQNAMPEEMVTAYVALSRVKEMEKIIVLQPFSMELFRSGPPAGPSILLRKLRGELTSQEARLELRRAAEADRERRKQARKTQSLHRCMRCWWKGRVAASWKPVEAFCSRERVDELVKYVYEPGPLIECIECRKEMADRRRAEGGQYGIRGREHGDKGGEHGDKGGEHGVKSGEHVLKGKEHGIKGGEHGEKGGEHGAKGAEHGMRGKQHGIKGGRPPAAQLKCKRCSAMLDRGLFDADELARGQKRACQSCVAGQRSESQRPVDRHLRTSMLCGLAFCCTARMLLQRLQARQRDPFGQSIEPDAQVDAVAAQRHSEDQWPAVANVIESQVRSCWSRRRCAG